MEIHKHPSDGRVPGNAVMVYVLELLAVEP